MAFGNFFMLHLYHFELLMLGIYTVLSYIIVVCISDVIYLYQSLYMYMYVEGYNI